MKHILIALALVFGLAGVSSAQVTIDSTTLSSNISASDKLVTLGAVTCTGCTFGAGAIIYIDQEAMRVGTSYVSGASNIPILRAQFQTKPQAHLTAILPYGNNVVYYGPANRFPQTDPVNTGSCRPRTQWQYLPWINVVTGGFWLCDNMNWRVLYLVAVNNVAASR